MKINLLSVFPEMFSPITENSLLGKACDKKLLEIDILNIRDFSQDKHLKTDDTPFGGGPGMVMFPQPVFDALRSLGLEDRKEHSRIIYMSPRGRIIDREYIEELSKEDEITILCGHYEGVDQRILDYWNMEEVSIGDYILTGGELPAMVMIDCVARFIPGVLGNEESAGDESVYSGLLEANQYTKPREYEGMHVPEVLTEGNHKRIRLYKLMESIRITGHRRPELLKRWMDSEPDLSGFTKKERAEIEKAARSAVK